MSTDQHPHDHDLVPEPPEAGADPSASTDDAVEAPADGATDSDEVAALREKLLLAHADMQNLRRRVERDVENAHKFALEKFVGDLVPVVDNLERALATVDRANDATAAVAEGVELTLKSFLDVLRRFNVEQLDPKGEPFNPERHEAMAMVPNPEVAANTVIEVFQKGYLLNGRLVRPAMVVVARNPADN
ncbi:MAG: nucleotide exchange factor GrpE [Pseudomonadota bacterium]|nr:nucleotide exchange factor GrpE [Pseudomonadota bacterium]